MLFQYFTSLNFKLNWSNEIITIVHQWIVFYNFLSNLESKTFKKLLSREFFSIQKFLSFALKYINAQNRSLLYQTQRRNIHSPRFNQKLLSRKFYSRIFILESCKDSRLNVNTEEFEKKNLARAIRKK